MTFVFDQILCLSSCMQMIHVSINGTNINKLIEQLNVELESLCTSISFKSNKLSLRTKKNFYMERD